MVTHTWLTATADLAADCFSTGNEEHDSPEDRVNRLVSQSIDQLEAAIPPALTSPALGQVEDTPDAPMPRTK